MDSRIDRPVEQAHRLLGNYRVLRLLGQGAFADVYLGEHVHLRTQAAIKVLQVRLVQSNIQSFLNEARTIAHLVHPYIIRVLDFGVEANTPFLVMDYAPQGTFKQRFLHGEPLPPTPLFPYIKQAAAALQYAHDKKLIHRDVKPENMLLGPNEEVLLSDFGFALMQTSLSRPSPETAGTASYMAPEQFQGQPQPASDQYSLAVVAYEWLAGVTPFQGTFLELASQHMVAQPPPLVQRVPGLSAQVAQVVMTALAKDPGQRFPSVRDFARALEHACLAPTRSASFSSLPPFPAAAPNGNANPALPTNPASSLSPLQNGQHSNHGLNSNHQLYTKSETFFSSASYTPSFQSGSNGFSSVSTVRPEQAQRLSSSFGGPQREQAQGTPFVFGPFQEELAEQPTAPRMQAVRVASSSGAHQREQAQRPLSLFGVLPQEQSQGISSSFRAPQQEQAQRPLSLFGVLPQEQVQRPSYPSVSLPLSQSGTNAMWPLQPNPQSSSSWWTASIPNPSTRQAVSTQQATGQLSQPMRSLPQQRMSQDRSLITNATNVSPLKSSGQSFSSVSSYSQSRLPALPQLPSLPYDPFAAPEFGRQNRLAPMALQPSTVQQRQATKGTRSFSPDARALNELSPLSTKQPDRPRITMQTSPSSAADQKSTASPTPLVRREDFWQTSKRSTSWVIYFFVALMLVLIIGSTGVLFIIQTHNRGNKSSDPHQSTPHVNVIGTAPSQLLAITVPDQIE